MSIAIQINGEPRELDEPKSLANVLSELGLEPRKIAVERNLEIVPRSTYADVMIQDGDRLEVVRVVGGG